MLRMEDRAFQIDERNWTTICGNCPRQTYYLKMYSDAPKRKRPKLEPGYDFAKEVKEMVTNVGSEVVHDNKKTIYKLDGREVGIVYHGSGDLWDLDSNRFCFLAMPAVPPSDRTVDLHRLCWHWFLALDVLVRHRVRDVIVGDPIGCKRTEIEDLTPQEQRERAFQSIKSLRLVLSRIFNDKKPRTLVLTFTFDAGKCVYHEYQKAFNRQKHNNWSVCLIHGITPLEELDKMVNENKNWGCFVPVAAAAIRSGHIMDDAIENPRNYIDSIPLKSTFYRLDTRIGTLTNNDLQINVNRAHSFLNALGFQENEVWP